jgi:hypothetical protein
MKNIFDTRKVRPTEVIIKNTSGELLPGNSFARITGYNKADQHFDVDKPDEDGISPNFVTMVPVSIPNGERGVGIIEGVGVVKKESGVSVSMGDTVGTGENKWEAVATVGFTVLHIDGDYLIVRRGVAGRIYARITKTLQREDPVALPPLPAIDRYEIEIIGMPPVTPALEAWVFGFNAEDYPNTPSLLDVDKWYQVGDEVEVVEYHDSRKPNRKWWIMGTVSRIVSGVGSGIECSQYWFQKIDGVKVARRGSVYR